MPKVTLNRDMFKALASDTRLDILRALDGKKMGLNEISKETKLNKATLHEHLTKLFEAGLVKKNGREGHKWVYYQLSWKGESLLHPENTRIVVLFSTTLFLMVVGVMHLILFVKGKVITLGYSMMSSQTKCYTYDTSTLMERSLDAITSHSGSFPQPLSKFFQYTNVKDIPTPIKCGYYGVDADSIASNTTTIAPGFGGVEEGIVDWSINTLGNGELGPPLPTGINNFAYRTDSTLEAVQSVYQNPVFLYIGIAVITIFVILTCITIWRYKKNQASHV